MSGDSSERVGDGSSLFGIDQECLLQTSKVQVKNTTLLYMNQ